MFSIIEYLRYKYVIFLLEIPNYMNLIFLTAEWNTPKAYTFYFFFYVNSYNEYNIIILLVFKCSLSVWFYFGFYIWINYFFNIKKCKKSNWQHIESLNKYSARVYQCHPHRSLYFFTFHSPELLWISIFLCVI